MITAIVLSVVTLSGIALWRQDNEPDYRPGKTIEPSTSDTTPPTGAPVGTATVTVFVTPLDAPASASGTGGGNGGGNGAAWAAAFGAIIAGVGTMASGAAAWATMRRGGRQVHRRTGEQPHRWR